MSTETGDQVFRNEFACQFNDPQFSDAIVSARGHEFHVHRVVLACHSPVMRKAFSGSWKEAREKKMDVDDAPAVVEAMLYFMYNFEYEGRGLCQHLDIPQVFHARVFAIADFYDIQMLKEYSTERFETALQAGFDINEFVAAIEVVYNSTPDTVRELRELVLKTMQQNIKVLTSESTFNECLRSVPEVAADLAIRLGKGPQASTGSWFAAPEGHYPEFYHVIGCHEGESGPDPITQFTLGFHKREHTWIGDALTRAQVYKIKCRCEDALKLRK